MITYTEYVRGQKSFENMISMSMLHKEYGGLKTNVFYPIVPFRDDEDVFPVDEVVKLPKEKVLVCEEPGTEPVEKELYIDSEKWAYEVIVTDGEPS